MVKVPEYTPDVALRPRYRSEFTVRANAEHMGAAVGRGMVAIAGGLSDVADAIGKRQALEDETAARSARNSYITELDALKYDPDAGYFLKSGKAAVTGFEDYRTKVSELRTKVEGSLRLTPAQGSLFARAVTSLEQDAQRGGLIHRGNALKSYVVEEAQSGIEAWKSQARLSYRDPAQFEKYTNAGLAEIGALGTKLGWSKTKLKLERDNWTSDLVKTTALHMAEDDPIAAVEFVAGRKASLMPDDYLAFVKAVAPRVGDAAARDAVVGVTGRVAPAPGADGSAGGARTIGQTGPTMARAALARRLTPGHSAASVDNLDERFATNLSAMIQEAPDFLKAGLTVNSGYRSPERQSVLFADAVKKYGSEAAARRWVAPPGRSFHNHGQAVDLGWYGKRLDQAPKEVIDWVHANAAKHGLYFPMSHEPWHIEPQGTRGAPPAPPAGSAAAVGGSSPPATGSRFSARVEAALAELPDDLSARVREAAVKGIDSFAADQNARLKAERSAVADSYRLRIATADPSLSEQEVLENPVLDDGDKAALVSSYREKSKDLVQTRDGIAAFQAGKLAIDPYGTEGRKLVDNIWGAVAGAVDKAQLVPTVEELVRQSGLLPSAVANALRGDLSTRDPRVVAGAAELALRLRAVDPAVFGRRDGGGEIADAAATFSQLTTVAGLGRLEAAQRMVAARDPDKARERAALMESKPIKDFIKDQAVESEVRDIFDPGLFGFDPKLGETPAQSAAMVAEYRSILEESIFDAAGDTSVGEKLATDRFHRRYGVSEFALSGSGIVTRLPPEVTYRPGKDGTHGYIRDQVKAALTAEGVTAEDVFLIADDMTERDFNSGRPPRYQVYYSRPDGVIERFRLPFYATAPSEEEIRADALRDAEARRDENRVLLEAGRDREGNLDRMLNGNPLSGGLETLFDNKPAEERPDAVR